MLWLSARWYENRNQEIYGKTCENIVIFIVSFVYSSEISFNILCFIIAFLVYILFLLVNQLFHD